jgi:nitronate monooxygenase
VLRNPVFHSAKNQLSLPVIGAPMFIVSGPELVIGQCLNGVVGSFPALNARPKEELTNWLSRISAALEEAASENPARVIAPFAVNLIVQQANERFRHDLDACVRHRVPIVITSLGAPSEAVAEIHSYGGIVIHDVVSVRHANKAIEAGADGIVLVCAGAGGHGGTLNPFAFVAEVRRFFDGLLVLSGGISTGHGILAAQLMGADLAYIGTRFIATEEANSSDGYKRMIIESSSSDIVNSALFTGFPGNYLKGSIIAAGLDPKDVATGSAKGAAEEAGRRDLLQEIYRNGYAKAWRDIWGAGHGVGSIDDAPPVARVIARLSREYSQARRSFFG